VADQSAIIPSLGGINIALADKPTTSLVCISCGILLFAPTGDLGGASPFSRLFILFTASGWLLRYVFPVHLALPYLVGYPGYSFTLGLNLDTSMPHAHLVRQVSV